MDFSIANNNTQTFFSLVAYFLCGSHLGLQKLAYQKRQKQLKNCKNVSFLALCSVMMSQFFVKLSLWIQKA